MLESILRAAGLDVDGLRQHRLARCVEAVPRRAGTACSPSSCPASSCTGRRRCGPAAGVRAERRRGPPRLARLDGRLRRGEGAGAARAGRGRGHRRPGGGRAAGRVRRRRGGSGSPWASRAPGQLGVVDGMLVDRAFGRPGALLADGAPTSRPPGARTTSTERARRGRAGAGRAGRRRPTRSRPGCAAFRPGPAPQRAGRRGRRGALRRRLQGHQPARRGRVAGRAAPAPVVWIAGGLLKGAVGRRAGRRGTRRACGRRW